MAGAGLGGISGSDFTSCDIERKKNRSELAVRGGMTGASSLQPYALLLHKVLGQLVAFPGPWGSSPSAASNA